MKALLFSLVKIKVWIITLLPLRVLYLLSYPLYFFLAIFPGYRKKVVETNLSNAFPGKEPKEIRAIRNKFYRHLADTFIEVIKMRHLGTEEMGRRFRLVNPGIMEELNRENRSSIAVFGHFGNWEWISAIQPLTSYKCLSVYKPLSNKYSDTYFKKIRSRWGVELVPMAETLKVMLNYMKEGTGTVIALISDQTPPRREIQYWTRFLNQDTPVYLGIEKLSAKYDLPVLFLDLKKIRRGYYELEIIPITFEPSKHKKYEITELHVRMLEDQIIKQPELWLWSHRRWKHKKPVA